MAHRVEGIGPGKVRVTVDLSDASLDSDLDAVVARFVTLKNVLTDRVPLRKRGSLLGAVSGALLPSGTSTGFGVYTGPQVSTASRDVNIATSNADGKHYAEWDGSSAGTDLGTASGAGANAYMLSPGMAEANLVWGGPTLRVYGGSTIARYTTGTATMTTSSTTVTLSDALSAGQQAAAPGAFILNTQDSTATKFAYKIVSVDSATTLTIDRPYAGSRSGAASTFVISAVGDAYTTNGTFSTGSPDILAQMGVLIAWNRVVLLQPAQSNGEPYTGRIAWSGILGSTEGTAPKTGMYGYSSTGYLDLPSAYGAIIGGVVYGSYVLIFCERRLVVLSGSPTFSSAGSLDASTSYPIRYTSVLAGGLPHRAACATPHGVFYCDRLEGAMLWRGGEPPRQVSSRRVSSLLRSYKISDVGYHRDHVFFMSATGAMVYSVLSDSWSEITGDVAVSFLQAGRDTGTDSTSQYLAGLSSDNHVVSVSNVVDAPGVAAADWNSTVITADVKTGKIGSPLGNLRPYRAWVTYRATDLTTTNPYLALTVNTGLPDSSDAAHTFTSASTDFPETTDVETKRVEINVGGDPMVQVRALQTNAAGKFDLYSLVIDCYDEGEAQSS